MFLDEGPDGKMRRMYLFYLHRNSIVSELKLQIKRDFGWDVSQISIYLNYKELINHEGLLKIEEFDNEEDVLLVHTNSRRPDTKLPLFLKPKMEDIRIEDVKYFNSSNENELQEGHEFPEYQDWHAELLEISNTISIANDELKSNIAKKQPLGLLIEAEHEFHILMQKFEKAAQQSVKTIVDTQSTPLNLFNLYGDGGKKYVSAGMFIRH